MILLVIYTPYNFVILFPKQEAAMWISIKPIYFSMKKSLSSIFPGEIVYEIHAGNGFITFSRF